MEIKELVDKIINASDLYYKGEPIITDDEFDGLIAQLKELDPDNEILTKTGWGIKLSSSKKKVKHKYGFSIGINDKIRPNELGKFIQNKGLSLTELIVSTKLDGASIFCYYTNGILDIALTRGDGEYGLDITQYIKYLVPNKINTSFTGFIRGEFILPQHMWETKYKDQGKSSRNFSAGKLNALDTDLEIIQDHKVICYYVFDINNPSMNCSEQLQFLYKNGFNIVANSVINLNVTSNQDASILLEDLQQQYMPNNFQCDGLVYMHGDNKRFAVKWNTLKVSTIVKDIKWQNSRLGKLKPVVIIEPVDIGGATINRVTGNNYQWLKDHHIGIGSEILITRSGDVIPKIEDVVIEKETPKLEVCPICQTKLDFDGTDLLCLNKNCGGFQEKILLHFINTVVPTDGLGEKVLSKFLSYFSINSIIDLITFAQTNFKFKLNAFCLKTSGFGNSIFTKLTEMLDKLNTELRIDKLLIGLGLPALSDKSIEKILELYDFKSLINAIENNTLTVFPGVNYLAIQSLYDNKDYILKVINSLTKDPIFILKKTRQNNIIYSEEKVCITGSLSVSRKAFLDECSEVGIQEASIAKATILVTNNTETGTKKNEEAKRRGIPVMSELEFRSKYLE